jgi:hypothetical protein
MGKIGSKGCGCAAVSLLLVALALLAAGHLAPGFLWWHLMTTPTVSQSESPETIEEAWR